MAPEQTGRMNRSIDARSDLYALGVTFYQMLTGVLPLHKVLVPPRGLFASGKFDQYKRDIPYATLAQAFHSLVRPLLGKRDDELSGWRDTLLETLGPNGRLMTDLVPELKLIIGDQPPLVFRRFIGVFAQSGHPLALFLDDLQWLDAATLDLLEDLLTRSDLQHLMLIGAYRDNEVDAVHPLRLKLDAVKNAGGKVAEITLAPLARERNYCAHNGDNGSHLLHWNVRSPVRKVPRTGTILM